MRTNETRHHIHTLAKRKLQVFLVFFGKRWNLNRDAGKVDALVLAKHAAVHDGALHLVAVDGIHDQLDQAVGEQDACARLKVLSQRSEDGAHALGGPFGHMRRDGDALARLQQDRLVVLQLGGTDLGALQVSQDTERTPDIDRDLAHHADQVGLLLVRAMREVQPDHIQAGMDQLAEDIFRATGWAEGGNDLGAAQNLCHGASRCDRRCTHA